MRRDVYSGFLKFNGEEHEKTLLAATNYTLSLGKLRRFKETKSWLRRTMPVARRVLGEGHGLTLKMRTLYAAALYASPGATLDDLREAVETSEEIARTTRRVLGATHPNSKEIEGVLKRARAKLRARETPEP